MKNATKYLVVVLIRFKNKIKLNPRSIRNRLLLFHSSISFVGLNLLNVVRQVFLCKVGVLDFRSLGSCFLNVVVNCILIPYVLCVCLRRLFLPCLLIPSAVQRNFLSINFLFCFPSPFGAVLFVPLILHTRFQQDNMLVYCLVCPVLATSVTDWNFSRR